MLNVINAGISRLFQNKVFRTVFIITVLYGTLAPYLYWDGNRLYRELDPTVPLFGFMLTLPFATAILISLFLGQEHSDGTLRRKLVIGKTKTEVYLGLMLSATVGVLLCCLGYLAADVAVSVLLMGLPKTALEAVLLFGLLSIVNILANTALFSALSLLIKSRAVSAVVCLMIAFITLILGIDAVGTLTQPELYEVDRNDAEWYAEAYDVEIRGQADPDTMLVDNPWYPNEDQVKSARRTIYLLPAAQSFVISQQLPVADPFVCGACSVIIAVLSTAVGVIIFARKDIN